MSPSRHHLGLHSGQRGGKEDRSPRREDLLAGAAEGLGHLRRQAGVDEARVGRRKLVDALAGFVSGIYLLQLPAVLLIAAALKTIQLILSPLPM